MIANTAKPVTQVGRSRPQSGNNDTTGHAAHTQEAAGRQSLPGKILRPIKVTMLGAGSGFTPRLASDVLSIENDAGGEIALVDIDRDRLKTMFGLVQRVVVQRGKEKTWTVTASEDRRKVLAGTDYLVNCIEVSGTSCVAIDNDVPLKYGVDQCIGDTMGPGGLFKALRTGPAWLDILADAERLCPDALVLNYTNPMSTLCLAAGRASKMAVVGLCHSVQHTCAQLADRAGVPVDELTFDVAGINHLAWYTRLEHGGDDLYPALKETALRELAAGASEVEPSRPDLVRKDMMVQFGAFITESSGHLSEYLPYYRKTPEAREAYCGPGYCGGSRFYADNWPDWRRTADEARLAMLRGEKSIDFPRSWEYASWIIEAREKDVPYRIYGNVMNQDATGSGRLITNLPADGCVEVACTVDRTGIHPTRFGALPPQMAWTCSNAMGYFDLSARAIIERSREAAVHALMLDPLTAAVCTPQQIRDMTNEMFDAQSDYLSEYA